MAHRITLLTAVVALAPALALAQATSPGAPAPSPAIAAPGGMLAAPGNISPAARTDQLEVRIKDLHARLKITPDQEPQWSSFAEVMRANARQMGELYQSGNPQRMNALEALQHYARIARAHSDEITALVSPFQTLYASLSPPQKRLADEAFHSFQRGGRLRG